jgi:hypothetical protein
MDLSVASVAGHVLGVSAPSDQVFDNHRHCLTAAKTQVCHAIAFAAILQSAYDCVVVVSTRVPEQPMGG